jgi:hypothetical protein
MHKKHVEVPQIYMRITHKYKYIFHYSLRPSVTSHIFPKEYFIRITNYKGIEYHQIPSNIILILLLHKATQGSH